MKTEASLLTKSLCVLGVFGISALTTYGAITNGWVLNSTPYQTRNSTADANLSRLTDGKGGPALDTVIAKIKATAEAKWGTPVNVTTYNAYIDNRLTAIDTMDNQVRTEFGSDYTFLFQYFYPRVAELKKTENKTTSLLSQIASVFGGGETAVNTNTTANNSTATNSIANSTVSTAANTSSTTAGTASTTVAAGTTPTYTGKSIPTLAVSKQSPVINGDLITFTWSANAEPNYGSITTCKPYLNGNAQMPRPAGETQGTFTQALSEWAYKMYIDCKFSSWVVRGSDIITIVVPPHKITNDFTLIAYDDVNYEFYVPSKYWYTWCSLSDGMNTGTRPAKSNWDLGTNATLVNGATAEKAVITLICRKDFKTGPDVVLVDKLPYKKLLGSPVTTMLASVVTTTSTTGTNFDQLVESWYTSKLGRASDAEGKAYWIKELNSGKSQVDIEKAFDYAVSIAKKASSTMCEAGKDAPVPSADKSNMCVFTWPATAAGQSYSGVGTNGGTLSGTCPASGVWENVKVVCPNKVVAMCEAGKDAPVPSADKSNMCVFTWPATAAGQSYSGVGTNGGTLSGTCPASGVWENVKVVCPNKAVTATTSNNSSRSTTDTSANINHGYQPSNSWDSSYSPANNSSVRDSYNYSQSSGANINHGYQSSNSWDTWSDSGNHGGYQSSNSWDTWSDSE